MSSIARRELFFGSLAALGASVLSADAPAAVPTNKHLVFVFMRGGVDGLGLASPLGADATRLAAFRPNLAVQNPLPLSSTLGVHRLLAPLLDDAAIRDRFNVVLQAGSLNETRSHFEQMDHVESGHATGTTTTGFLGAAANALGRSTVAVGALLPSSLRGANPIVLSDPARVQASYAHGGLRPGLTRAQRMALYQKAGNESGDVLVDTLARQAQSQLDGIASALRDVTLAGLVSAGSYINSSFGQRLAVAARMFDTPANPAIVTIDAEHGWDTHNNQGTNDPTGFHAYGKKVDDLARNLRAFKNDLVRRGKWDNTAIVLLSEFGRTVRENANQGSDHGRGGVMLLLGGAVRCHADAAYSGPRAYTLPQSVDESSALDVRCDYRVVMAELLQRHLGLSQATSLGLFRPVSSVSANGYLNVVRGS